MSTTVWHQGKVRVFSSNADAATYIEEINMARAKSKNRYYELDTEPKSEPFPTESPQVCDDSCGISVEVDNKGGFQVTHRSRGGNLISGHFQEGESYEEWLVKVHADEA